MDRKEFMQNRRKELKAAIDEGRDFRKTAEMIHREYMEDDKLDIHINVDDLYDPLSTEKFRQLNGDIFDYVERCAKLIPVHVPIRLILRGVEEEDKADVPALFKRHYQIELQDDFWAQRVNKIKMICLLAVGVIALMIFMYFAFRHDDNLFLEILSIIGSFSVWEAVNCFLVEGLEIRKTLHKTAQFLTTEIEFEE